MTNRVLIIVTLALGAVRFAITPRLDLPTAEGTYEAIAHMFVGGLFGAWLVKRSEWQWLVMGIAVSLLELGMFIAQKSGWLPS